jgi:hypothetical protein
MRRCTDGGAVNFGEGHEHGDHPHKYCERQQQRNGQDRSLAAPQSPRLSSARASAFK